MGKNPQPKKNEKSSTKKIDPTIAVAIIGLCGTLLAAILASPVLIAWIQKSNSPIIPPAETLAFQPPIPTETIIDTTTPPPSPTLTSIPLGQDWKSFLKLNLQSPCAPRLLPPNINPNEDISVAEQQLSQAKANNEFLDWLVAPILLEEGVGFATLQVSSIVTETEWVKISNELLINVTTQEMLDHVNVFDDSQCGGVGEIRRFPLFNLSNDFNVYELKSTYAEADFFTLEPGEFEEFYIPYKCTAVGIYQFKINASYEYSGISNVTDSDQTIGIICPQTFTFWDFNPFTYKFLSSTTYQWNGSRYEKKP